MALVSDPQKAEMEVKERDKGWDLRGEDEYFVYLPAFFEAGQSAKVDVAKKQQQFIQFKEAKKSKGFDFTCPIPPPEIARGFFLILPEHEEYPGDLFWGYGNNVRDVNHLAPAAVDFHNKKTGAQLKYACWKKANHCKSYGGFYYITLFARDERSNLFKKCLTRVHRHYHPFDPDRLDHTVESFSIAGDVDELPTSPPHTLDPAVKLVHIDFSPNMLSYMFGGLQI